MTEVTDIADDYESASEALKSLAQCSDAAIAILQPANGQLKALGAGLDGASEALKELQQATEQTGSRTEALADGLKEALSPLTEAASEAASSISEVFISIEGAGNGFVSEVGEALDNARNSQAESRALFDLAEMSVNQVYDTVETAETLVEGVLEKFSATVQEAYGKIDSSGDQVTGAFGAIIEGIPSEMMPGAAAAMEKASQLASGDFVNLAETRIGELKDAAESVFSNFEDVTTVLGEKLEQRASDIFSQLSAHASDFASSKVSESVEDIINTAVATLTAEIAEAVTLIGAGSSTTALLSPVLPQLAAAKAVVGTIERALALLDSIF
jgi:hypothetical protein